MGIDVCALFRLPIRDTAIRTGFCLRCERRGLAAFPPPNVPLNLPLPLLRGLGWLIGRVLFVLAAPRRRVALRNLALCYPEVTVQQRRQWAPRMASGEWLASYCLTEPGAGSDAAALATRAVRDGDDYVLTGTKQFISGAGTSDVYVVMARTGGAGPRGISAFLVERDAPGLDFGAEERKMGWHAQPTRQVLLEGVRVPAANLLGGEEGTGFGIAMKGLNGGRLNIAACSLGGARAAAAAATRHVRDREAFGAPLVEEPTIRFALADMATALEASRALLWRAAEALDDGAEDAAEKCAMAKRFVTDECFGVADRALQLFGGYGYLAEYGVEKLVRDLRVHRILEGTNEIMRVVAGRSVATRGIGV